MTDIALSRLEKVDLRNAWASEAGDFTPWLASEENISLLGDTIGIELEVEAQEKEVGPFRADILCKDTATGNWVLIENQLERTDHTHLGQLLTYAAGLKAVTIVWIADRFTEEHRAALDWLNDITDDRFNFFGLDVELWRIADSPVAPKFNVVSKPNDWTKDVARGASRVGKSDLTDRQQLQLEFWTHFREHAQTHATRIKTTKPLPRQCMDIAIGRTGFRLLAIASLYDSVAKSYDGHELRTELWIDNDDSKVYFAMLENMKADIEKDLGGDLTWHNPSDNRSCRIYVRHPVELNDRLRWGEYHEWLLNNLEAFHKTFAPIVKRLDANEYDAQESGVSE